VSLSSYRADVVTGSISHIQIHVVTTACHWVIDGTGAAASNGVITFRYSDSTGKLTSTRSGAEGHVGGEDVARVPVEILARR
jgi:4-alpha-glucanotransferase